MAKYIGIGLIGSLFGYCVGHIQSNSCYDNESSKNQNKILDLSEQNRLMNDKYNDLKNKYDILNNNLPVDIKDTFEKLITCTNELQNCQNKKPEIIYKTKYVNSRGQIVYRYGRRD